VSVDARGRCAFISEVSQPTQRVALAESVTRDDVDDAMHALGWQLTNVVPPTAERPGQLVFASRDAQTVLCMVDDVRLGVTYFVANGVDVAGELAAVAERFACEGLDAVGELVTDMSNLYRFRRGIGLMALLLTEPDPACVDLFERAFAHGDARVRALALTAASYVTWDEMQPLLAQVCEDDPSPAIREAAGRLLAARAGEGAA
jgi:hypothetical protein